MEVNAKKSGNGSGSAAAKGPRASTNNNSDGSGTATTVERKEIERRRRQHMKGLCVKLASLIPKEHYSSELVSLDEAAAYIKKLKERVDELQQKRSAAQLMAGMIGGGRASVSSAMTTSSSAGSEQVNEEAVPAPVVEVRHHHDESSLDVTLISSMERPFKLHEVVTVLEEEGAEIINANFNVAGRKIFYAIHCRAFSPRIGIQVSRVSERLRALAWY